MNPYKSLHSKVRHLINAESKLAPDERKTHEWLLTITVDGFRILVGKGGVNTIFYSFGKGDKKFCYPDEMLEKLEFLANRKFWFYKVGDARVMTESAALKRPPKGLIVGVNETNSVLYKAKPTLNGVEWVHT